ncbi:MAG: HEAT repeat domain-containing protein [Proteobacteria bacterium]|nr:HEAT repeat domain-containing protein [Pseudomonadota bacterium]
MPSRLSSLMVRDGLVGVKRMEHAFQRQVIYGGCLDTILLEMSLVPEERLLQYLSLATGLPPATRNETNVFDPEAVKKCSADLAKAYRVVPLCFEEGALRVLVHDPVDLGLLEELANQLEFPIQPLVVPEYRFHLVFSRMYGGVPNARFTELARRSEESATSSPVGKARSVIIEDPGPTSRDADDDQDSAEHVVVDVGIPPSTHRDQSGLVSKPGSGPFEHGVEQDSRSAGHAPGTPGRAAPYDSASHSSPSPEHHAQDRLLGQAHTEPMPTDNSVDSPARPSGTRSTRPGVGEPPRLPALPGHEPEGNYGEAEGSHGEPVSSHGEPARSVPAGAVGLPRDSTTQPTTSPLGSRNAPTGEDRVIQPRARPSATLPRVDRDEDLLGSPLSPAEARDALATAEDRDLIFSVLLRAIYQRSQYAALLTVQGGVAIGRIALSYEHFDREEIGGVLIPLDSASAFHSVVASGAPHIGPVATGDTEIDEMITRMGNCLPPSALLLPVVLRNRVVAIAVGHNGEDPIDVNEVSQLLPLASLAAAAISRVIMKAKTRAAEELQAVRVQPETVAPNRGDQPPIDDLPTTPFTRLEADDVDSDAEFEDGDGDALGMTMETVEPEPIEAVLDAVESPDPQNSTQAKAAALARVEETLATLSAGRFPGKLHIDRYELGGRALPPEQHGPILDMVIRIGQAACDMLIDKMRHSDRDVRYYATICVVELHPRAAIPALIERLFDSDYGIRSASIDALSAFPDSDLDQALTRVRQALHSDDSSRVQAAAQALASLGDIRAIPDLLTALARGDKGSDPARRALIQLTKQNFGSSHRKWRGWWSKHKNKHRVEWLIEGLANKDDNLRRSAAEDLRNVTGEYFDYRYDMPRKEREQARQRWLDWWNELGRKRFIKSDEDRRSTAVLPGKGTT